MPARTPAHEKRAAEMLSLRQQGKTLAEIGEKYGLTAERVRQIIHSVLRPRHSFRREGLADKGSPRPNA